MTVGTPTVDANGVKYYPVTSVYQGFLQIIRVLQPTNPASGKPPRLLYVLPVESGVDTLSSPLSDGLEELRLLNVPNQFNMTLIAPSFGYEPWYGDDILDSKRMESFVIDDLVPWGDTFATGSVAQRYLIGFSKSGNGALDLILRHPGVFNGVAAWDSPTQLNDVSSYSGMPINFGTQANFSSYIIPNLVTSNANPFQQQIRI
jgi:S-formylglutathione hydrolase FrmB